MASKKKPPAPKKPTNGDARKTEELSPTMLVALEKVKGMKEK